MPERASAAPRRWPFPVAIGAAAGALLVALVLPIRSGSTFVATPSSGSRDDDPGLADDAGAGAGTTATATAQADGASNPGSGGAAGTTTTGRATSSSEATVATSAGGAAGGAAVPGVSPTTVRIGVGLPDLGAIAALGPNYDNGNVRAQMNAVLAGWHEQGLLPVHGRDVEFVYRSYDIVGVEQQRAACIGWATDDDVFAVIAVNNYWAAGECLAGEHDVPLLVNDIYEQSVIDRSSPYLFTVPYSLDQLMRNWAHFAAESGLLTPTTRIGLYYGTGAGGADIVEGTFQDELDRLGFGDQVVARVTTDNYATGGPEDPIAAQRFAAARVDLALILVSAVGQTNFQHAASTLGYRPRYLGSDFLFTTNDTAAATFRADQYDGTLAMTSFRFGEESAGFGVSADAAACAANYAAHGGPTVTYRQRPAEWMALQQGCGVARLLLAALQSAGVDLDRDRLVAALEGLPAQAMEVYADVDFSAGDHTGTSASRTLRWSATCTCWQATGPFTPYRVS